MCCALEYGDGVSALNTLAPAGMQRLGAET